jgi:hypothetical protein
LLRVVDGGARSQEWDQLLAIAWGGTLEGSDAMQRYVRCASSLVSMIDCTAFANRTRPGGIASPSAFGAKRARRSPGHFLHYRSDKVVPVFFSCAFRDFADARSRRVATKVAHAVS